MSAYHQMGNDSINLVFEEGLASYKGAILSPVNCDKANTLKLVNRMRALDRLEIVFDPQLYYPKSDRGCLPSWDYFPKDVETADLTGAGWWDGVVDQIVDSMTALMPDAICSPALVPKGFPDDFFVHLVGVSDHLTARLKGSTCQSVLTVIVGLQEVAQAGRALTIASILSKAKSDRAYIVFLSEVDPRKEIQDPEELKGAMKLIGALEGAGISTLVSFCSTDVLLWKAAGATSCATGKFFNLRRFTLKRFAEPSSGGGQLPYWFEEALLAFLRQSDLVRVQQKGILSASSIANPFGPAIYEKIPQRKPWIAESWRQYMWWFANVEERLSIGTAKVFELLATADASWSVLDSPPRTILEERGNNGEWIRQWQRAVEELDSFQ